MTTRAAIATITVCTLLLASIGGGIGWALGTFAPGYYRSVFRNGNEPGFDPVSVGVGQGLTQGTTGGVIVGLILVALFLWRDSRGGRYPDVTPPPDGNGPAGGSGPPVGRYIGGLLAPWLVLAVGFAGLMAVPDPHLAFGLGYCLLFACLFVILTAMGAGIWSLARSASRRRSAWAWGFLSGCFVNMLLLGMIG